MTFAPALTIATFGILVICMIISCASAWYTRRQAKAASRRALRSLEATSRRIIADSMVSAATAELALARRTDTSTYAAASYGQHAGAAA